MSTSDYSEEYTSDKRGAIFIGAYGKVLKFKPFIKSLSYETKYEEIKTVDKVYSNPTLTGPMDSVTYKIDFEVPAQSAEEAIENHKKFQIFLRMIFPFVGDPNGKRNIYVKFSNIIHGGDPKNYRNLSFSQLKEKGMLGQIFKLDYKPDYSMGFFETQGMIFAKVFSVSLVLDIPDPQTRNNMTTGQLSGFEYAGKKPGRRAPIAGGGSSATGGSNGGTGGGTTMDPNDPQPVMDAPVNEQTDPQDREDDQNTSPANTGGGSSAGGVGSDGTESSDNPPTSQSEVEFGTSEQVEDFDNPYGETVLEPDEQPVSPSDTQSDELGQSFLDTSPDEPTDGDGAQQQSESEQAVANQISDAGQPQAGATGNGETVEREDPNQSEETVSEQPESGQDQSPQLDPGGAEVPIITGGCSLDKFAINGDATPDCDF